MGSTPGPREEMGRAGGEGEGRRASLAEPAAGGEEAGPAEHYTV